MVNLYGQIDKVCDLHTKKIPLYVCEDFLVLLMKAGPFILLEPDQVNGAGIWAVEFVSAS